MERALRKKGNGSAGSRCVAQEGSGGMRGNDAGSAPDNSPLMVAQQQKAEETLQGGFISQATAQRREEIAAKPSNTGLSNNLKTGIQSISDMSMDNVRNVHVHYNSPQSAQPNALAYAQGSDIHVVPGQEQHLPHEAWHVVQQAQGRVRPTMQLKDGVPVNDDAGSEHEADTGEAKPGRNSRRWSRTT